MLTIADSTKSKTCTARSKSSSGRPRSQVQSANHATDISSHPQSSTIPQKILGPIVPLLKWTDEDDVIDRANALKTGLGASVWSKDLKRAERMARRLEAGSVWVNSHFDVDPRVPFGGHKESGIGMEWGMEGLKHYTNSTSIWVWKKVFE
jgi:acyl-CoA reductase-like NAD-dependent aldehyde dehydrogenase